jgi:uncharacterized protein YfeS
MKSHKFWCIDYSGYDFSVNYGKSGSIGKFEIKEFETEEECLKQAEKLIRSKEKKGYVEDTGFDFMNKIYIDSEEYGLHPKTSHPRFTEHFTEELYYDCVDEEAPFGSDEGSDTLDSLEETIRKNPKLNFLDYPKYLIEHDWGMEYIPVESLDPEVVKKLASKKEMKLAIKAKYNTKIDELATAHEQNIINKQKEAMRIRFETEIAQAYDNEEEILRIRMEQKKAELDSLQQMEGESIEAFNLRKLEAQNAYLESKKELSDKEIEIEQAKYEAMEQVTNGLVALTEQIGESDRGFAMASKMLALAEIAINSGKAIAKMVSAESGKGILGIATMASGIATILSNIANAVKIVKSAKFAEGGLVTGPGTGTSDSIPAQLSNGESVITAKATSMFAPILSSFNMMGGGVPINVTATNNQTLGEDMLARAVAKGMMMAPAPVVSVEEFTSVANRIKYIEESGSL